MVVSAMIDKIFIYPTDTVWGIGASIFSMPATKKIASIKMTNDNKPLSVLFSSIAQLRQYIALPKTLGDDWLKHFFSLESTMAISRSLASDRIPSWVLGDSDLVAVRCLDFHGTNEIIDQLHSPITTTSFNLSGQPALSNRDEAYDLYLKIASTHSFIDDPSATLSGNSSTIIKLESDFTFTVLRKGNKTEEILKHVRLLSA